MLEETGEEYNGLDKRTRRVILKEAELDEFKAIEIWT